MVSSPTRGADATSLLYDAASAVGGPEADIESPDISLRFNPYGDLRGPEVYPGGGSAGMALDDRRRRVEARRG